MTPHDLPTVPLVVVHPSAPARGRRGMWPAPADRVAVQRLVLILAVIVGVGLALLGIWAARAALLLTYVSALVSTGLLPFVRRVEQATSRMKGRRVPRWVVVAGVYCLFLGALALIVVLIVPPLLSQVGQLRTSLPGLIARSQAGLVRHGLLSRSLTVEDAALLTPSGVTTPVAVEASAVLRVVGGVFGAVTMLVLSFYFLIDGPRMFAYLTGFLPAARRPSVTAIARDVTCRVSAWLRGNLILGCIMGSATAIALGSVGEPFFYIVALVAALGEMVPVAGPLLAGVFAIALALTVSVKLAVSVGIVFLILHLLEANVLVPRIMARQVGLSSLAIFIALLVGFEWFGVAGVILAIPTLGIVAATVEELRSEKTPAANR